jgi:hypothetical protein
VRYPHHQAAGLRARALFTRDLTEPEITASVTAIAGGHATVGIGVTLGSNVFNLAALLGLSALIAGRVGFHRRSILLEGGRLMSSSPCPRRSRTARIPG